MITSVNGEPVVTYQDLIDELATVAPGEDVVLGVDRGARPWT
ncbi:hypothetical protein NKG05_03715 [Oerskovia sp. M15]